MYTDETRDLAVEVDTENLELSESDESKIREQLTMVGKLVASFPVAEAHVRLERSSRSGDSRASVSLRLPKRTLVVGDSNDHALTAFSRCVRKLVREVKEYKDKLEGKAEQTKVAKGTKRVTRPEAEPDGERIEKAVGRGDFAAFRDAVRLYDDALEARIGRWVERLPTADAELGDAFTIRGLLEAVYVSAFEQLGERPGAVPLGTWIEGLIDPVVRRAVRKTDQLRAEIAQAEELEADIPRSEDVSREKRP